MVRFLAYLELVSRDDREMWNKLSQNFQPLNQRWSGKWRKSLHTQCNHTIYFLTRFKKNVIELWKTVIRHYYTFHFRLKQASHTSTSIILKFIFRKRKKNQMPELMYSLRCLFFVSLDTRNRKFYRQFWKSFACLWRSAQRCGNIFNKKKIRMQTKVENYNFPVINCNEQQLLYMRISHDTVI